MGLLDDDKEYIDGIIETSFWGLAFYLRKLFAMLLLTGSISRAKYVWDNTWKMLSEDVLSRQRGVQFFNIIKLVFSHGQFYVAVD